MRTVLLAFFLASSVAAARAQPSATAALSNGEEIALIGIPVLATAGAVAALTPDHVSLGAALALPLVPLAAVCGTGLVFRIDGDCRLAFLSTALWSVPGYGLIGLGLSTDEWDVGLSSLFLGALWIVVVPPFAAYAGYRVSVDLAPAVVSDPATHRLAPGVQFRVGL